MVDSISDANMQDLIDTVSAFIDELPETQETMNSSIGALEEFLAKDNKKGDFKESEREILYPFRKDTQPIWLKQKMILDRSLSRSYPVIRDLINSALTIGQQEQTIDKSLTTQLQEIRQPPLTQINLASPQKTEGIASRITNFINHPKKVEDVIENPWETTHDIVLEAKQTPNVWKKLTKAHATGVLRAYFFKTSMDNWRQIELWYLTAHVEPEIMKMIEASESITRRDDMRTIATILTKYYEQKEQEQKSLAFG
jgi:hypothetical protein